MTAEQPELFRELAGRYIGWKTTEESVRLPQWVMAQTMNFDDYADVVRLVAAFGDGPLQEVLRTSEVGQFNERLWHYRLGIAELGTVPVMALKRTASAQKRC